MSFEPKPIFPRRPRLPQLGTRNDTVFGIGAHNGADRTKGYSMTQLYRYSGHGDLWSQFDRAVEEAFGEFPFSKSGYPRVDVIEYDDKLVLEAEIAGLNKEDVSVELEGDTLVIRGGKKQQANQDGPKGRYLFKEIKRSSFARSFILSENINKKAIKADFKDGTLKIELPRLKPEEKTPAKIKLL